MGPREAKTDSRWLNTYSSEKIKFMLKLYHLAPLFLIVGRELQCWCCEPLLELARVNSTRHGVGKMKSNISFISQGVIAYEGTTRHTYS